MSLKNTIYDPILLQESSALLGQALNQEKRWAGTAYMPEQYADTVYEHILSTKKTFAQMVDIGGQTPYTQELKTVGHHMIDMHDVPEIYGELLLGGQEQALAKMGFDPHSIEIRTFAHAFRCAEQAVRSNTHGTFFDEVGAIKSFVKMEKETRIAAGADRFCLNLLKDMFHLLSDRLGPATQDASLAESNILFAQECFDTIEDDDARQDSFAATIAKIVEKNDAGNHMGTVYQAMYRIHGLDAVPYRIIQNKAILNSTYRTPRTLNGIFTTGDTVAENQEAHQNIAENTVRLVYDTYQKFLKFGPDYVDLDNRNADNQPTIGDAPSDHAAYQADLRARYDAQNADDPATHRVIKKEELLHRLEANKVVLFVPQKGHDALCIDPSPQDVAYWKAYADLKRAGWQAALPI